MNKAQAIQTLRPQAQWVLRGDDLEWLDTEQTEPTEAELQAEIVRLTEEYNATEYQRNRAKEYPSIVDQLDDLFHNGIDGWRETIANVKAKYPKEVINE